MAEGAGQKLVADASSGVDASGNACAQPQQPLFIETSSKSVLCSRHALLCTEVFKQRRSLLTWCLLRSSFTVEVSPGSRRGDKQYILCACRILKDIGTYLKEAFKQHINVRH